jgi:hypothetical protein
VVGIGKHNPNLGGRLHAAKPYTKGRRYCPVLTVTQTEPSAAAADKLGYGRVRGFSALIRSSYNYVKAAQILRQLSGSGYADMGHGTKISKKRIECRWRGKVEKKKGEGRVADHTILAKKRW